ncbi:MAG: methyltransferase [Candidatus Pacearchaeota archaeon]|nr:methyltransferase [Candidatus Pacearchaeota archaeon]
MQGIYQPAEDSLFLSKFLKKEIVKIKPKKILDMGSGSGIQAKTCIKSGIKPKQITLADINKSAIDILRKRFPDSKVISSDLFGKIKERYDLIVFNPPYLPENEFDREQDTTGGKNGSEVINRFLEQAKDHLLPEGIILILTSSLTKRIDWSGYRKRLLGKKKLFFEELYVWGLNSK